jgi:transposase
LELTAEQWEVLESLIPEPPHRADRWGRPWREPRDVLSGILWVLHAGGAPSRDFPERYPPYHTCHRHFQQRIEEGVLEKVLHASAVDLKERGGLELSECFVDGTFVGAKKGRIGGKSKRGKGAKLMALTERSGHPISVHAASASAYEVTLVEALLATSSLGEEPEV